MFLIFVFIRYSEGGIPHVWFFVVFCFCFLKCLIATLMGNPTFRNELLKLLVLWPCPVLSKKKKKKKDGGKVSKDTVASLR